MGEIHVVRVYAIYLFVLFLSGGKSTSILQCINYCYRIGKFHMAGSAEVSFLFK